jgi:hypothetical protein
MRENRFMAYTSAQSAWRRAEHRPLARALAAALAVWLGAATGGPVAARERAPQAAWTPALEAEAARLEAALAQAEPAAAGALRVRLAFGGEADLDLYVTDPLAETLYFANERAASGGRLIADARCDSPAPRIEEVLFAAPLPGSYRVGVDYMVYRASCGEQPRVVAYVLAIDGPQGRRIERGLARRGIFDPRVLELTLGDVHTPR